MTRFKISNIIRKCAWIWHGSKTNTYIIIDERDVSKVPCID